jgi:hypothetical protein
VDAKITLLADAETWRRFRVACLERGIVAGRAFEKFMKQQLAQQAKEKNR